MNNDIILKREEKITYALRSLYQKYGYVQYKMSKFEEYDLYASNKEFLVSDHVITFTDTNGKLMALKPDVTLSIVRNCKAQKNYVEKVYYNENVYRISNGTKDFKEIMQVGLECIGDIDDYIVYEVLMLAAQTLKEISSESILNIAHLDIIRQMLSELQVPSDVEKKLMKCIESKNLHEFASLCIEAGGDTRKMEQMLLLMQLHGSPAEVLPALKELECNVDAVAQLEKILPILTAQGLNDMIRIDFSAMNDLKYYNGIVFQGFVSGVPSIVLSGGQYDLLMRKMGKKSKAVGFGVYMDQIERLGRNERQYDVDLLLLYDDQTDLSSLCEAVNSLTATNVNVMVQKQIPEKLKYRLLARLQGKEVEIIENNA